MSQKEIAVSFLKMAASGEVKTAYERFVAPHMIHHNQYFNGDRQSLMVAMEEAHLKSPNRSIEIKRVITEGDLVVTHSLVTRQNPRDPRIAVVHIFRFEKDYIAELWDLGQPILADSPNQNGLF